MSDNSISLNKYISSTGLCSRREADKLIEAGRVKLNGQVAKKGNRVVDGDTVTVDGKSLHSKPKPIYIALNKPPGITCTTDQRDPDNIIDFINHPQRIFPIGRLDKPSSGLIFLTNDGDIVNEILRVEGSLRVFRDMEKAGIDQIPISKNPLETTEVIDEVDVQVSGSEPNNSNGSTL